MSSKSSLRLSIANFAQVLHSFIKKSLPALLIGLTFAAISAGSAFRIFETYELLTYDWRYRLKPSSFVSDKIVLIEIDDRSLEAIGQWPFPRDYHAGLIDFLNLADARMLGVDLLLTDASSGDEALAEAAEDFGRVYFSEAFYAPFWSAGRVTSDRLLAPLIPSFRQAARGVGHVNAVADRDGKRRRIPPFIEYRNQLYPQLGVRMALDEFQIPVDQITLEGSRVRLSEDLLLPLDAKGNLMVHFAGRWSETFRKFSYAELILSLNQIRTGQKPLIDPAELKDAVCFLGMTATGSHDINPIPLEPIYPQVGIHANVYNNLLNGDFIRRVSLWINLGLLIFLVLLALAWTRIQRLSLSVFVALGVALIFVGVVIALFQFFLLWVDLFYPLLIYGLFYLGGIVRRTGLEKRKRELIEAELTIASRIQKSFLPAELPQTGSLDIAAYMKPAKHVGGDLYTALPIQATTVGILLGDVSGKGTPAALFMAKTISEFKFHSRGITDPAQVLTNLNESLSADDSSGLFVTANYAIFNDEEKRLFLSNAGHMPVLRVRADGEISFLTPDGGMPLAVMTGVEFMNLNIPYLSGDIFVLYSDGVTEARNSSGTDYETERLSAIVKIHNSLSSNEIQLKILEDIERFVGRAAQHDDMTLFVIKAA